jgi:hypothetical protein
MTLALLGGLACGGSADNTELLRQGDTDWLGSFGHAALCDASDAAGICLPGCSTSTECGPGLACTVGACVPEAALPTGSELGSPGPTGALETSGAAAYAVLGDDDWFLSTPPEISDYASVCADPANCPTLEALLTTDTCFEVRRGCGLTYLNGRRSLPLSTSHFWYDSYGEPPVGVYHAFPRLFAIERSIECNVIELACSTCGQPSAVLSPFGTSDVACEDVPGALPEPPAPPPAMPGCECEPDTDGGAQVSLPCFCELYGCPAYSELLLSCLPEADAPSSLAAVFRDACGQTWFGTADYRGQRYTFDPVTGELTGAVAFSPGPVTSPCGTYRVSAGALACEVTDLCRCSPAYTRDSCNDASWFGAL